MFAGTRRSRRRRRRPAPVQDSGLGSAVALLSTGATSIAIKTILMMMMLLMMTMMSKFSAWSSLSQPGRVLWREPWGEAGWSRGGSCCRLVVFCARFAHCTRFAHHNQRHWKWCNCQKEEGGTRGWNAGLDFQAVLMKLSPKTRTYPKMTMIMRG